MLMLLSFGILLAVARLLGELAEKLHQPAVLGELLAGILLGPTVLGNMAPAAVQFLFPPQGPNAIALEALSTLAIVLFLLVAGIEVDLSTVWRQGNVGLKVGVVGMAVPFALGLAAAWAAPHALGREPGADPVVFALFLATALSITALPVIAKTLMDLGLYRSDMGMVVVSAAIFNDLVGWIAFAIVISMMGTVSAHSHSIAVTIALTLGFVAVMLTLGRWAIHRILPALQAYTRWPGGVLSFALTMAVLAAAFTEWIGIHAIFGSFIFGVALGDSPHLRERTRVIIDQFVSFVFAPVFFASIGLRVNFVARFDPLLVLTILLVACACKLAGGILGAKWGGMSARDAWAVGFAMNARGAMEIILGLLAMQAGIIRERLFVAIVIMAIVTSMLSGPLMNLILKPTRGRRLQDVVSSRLFLRDMAAANSREAIHELTALACQNAGLDAGAIENAVWAREQALPTGIGNGVAIPHARVAGVGDSMVATGFSETGVDFDAPDGMPANLIFLIVTPETDPASQLELGADIARSFRNPSMLERALRTSSYTEFLALLKSASGEE
ncbi:MAG TPA: cation:proton antiporter [Candidatus Hydrogenedentes bacterium]|nr:cation:proton antiporter [Candidatus Hydrogenedentota bacterium]